MGETQINKTLRELEEIYKSLNSILKELNKDYIRNKKYDFQLMDENRLNQLLRSHVKLEEKKRILLTQIGYLRVNIFTEYLERVNLLQEKKQLNQAADLMNKYAEIASIFILTKEQPTIAMQLRRLFSKQRSDPIEYLQKWQTHYESWSKQNKEPIDEKRMADFQQLKRAYIELYTFSFSIENFPPLRYRRLDH